MTGRLESLSFSHKSSDIDQAVRIKKQILENEMQRERLEINLSRYCKIQNFLRKLPQFLLEIDASSSKAAPPSRKLNFVSRKPGGRFHP